MTTGGFLLHLPVSFGVVNLSAGEPFPVPLLCAAAMLEEFTLVKSCRFGYVFVQVFSA